MRRSHLFVSDGVMPQMSSISPEKLLLVADPSRKITPGHRPLLDEILSAPQLTLSRLKTEHGATEQAYAIISPWPGFLPSRAGTSNQTTTERHIGGFRGVGAVFVSGRSGMGAYVGAARRRVQLATVLLRSPSGHRPDRRQTGHARILRIDLRLAIAQATPCRPGIT